MGEQPTDTGARVNRRSFLRRGLVAGGALVAGGSAAFAARGERSAPPGRTHVLGRTVRARRRQPNLLVVLVDQLRFPRWFWPAAGAAGLPPNLAALRAGSVAFGGHYTAANDCTPARATLLTGLYAHQTGCLITGASTLDPGFSTWGSILREHGYQTYWFGKWHLTHGDHHWTRADGSPALERYGFSGGTYPSPDGAPGEGWRVDPHITEQFAAWYDHHAGDEPWCTTVSLVNPHDISWWYEFSDRVPAEGGAPRAVHRLPPNFETPEQLLARGKPRLQRSFQETSASSFGAVPFAGPGMREAWLPFLDLYLKLQLRVDEHIGHVMRTLHRRRAVAENTIVIFTSDHGEYGASHGMRGKGAAVYEEGIRVPLLVRDPRRRLAAQPGRVRRQLTSSVDIVPLLLTIGTGSNAWRSDSYYAHLAGRVDIARMLTDPQAPGRPYVLHSTDEIVTEFATELYAADAPLHVIMLRTPSAKYAVYANWAAGSIDPLSNGQESELYDYRTPGGRLEIDNSVARSPLTEKLDRLLLHAFETELRAPLPAHLLRARQVGIDDYLYTAQRVAVAQTERRRRRRRRRHQLTHLRPTPRLF